MPDGHDFRFTVGLYSKVQSFDFHRQSGQLFVCEVSVGFDNKTGGIDSPG